MKPISGSNSQKKKKLARYAHLKDNRLKVYSNYLKKFVFLPFIEKDKVDWAKWINYGHPVPLYKNLYQPGCKACNAYGSNGCGEICQVCDGSGWAKFVTSP